MTTFAHVRIPLASTFLDYPSPSKNAVSVYIMGCGHKCKGCFNPLFADIDYSDNTMLITPDKLYENIVDKCKRNKTNRIVFLGGDPLYSTNALFLIELLKKLKDNYETCIYTGYTVEEVKKILPSNIYFTYLKCGKYELDKKQVSSKNDKYIQFSSSNQELYDSNYIQLSKKGKFIFDIHKICDEDELD